MEMYRCGDMHAMNVQVLHAHCFRGFRAGFSEAADCLLIFYLTGNFTVGCELANGNATIRSTHGKWPVAHRRGESGHGKPVQQCCALASTTGYFTCTLRAFIV